MASPLNWTAKQLVMHDGELELVSVVVRQGSNVVTVRPRPGRGDVIVRDQVASVVQTIPNRHAEITFADGTVWKVEKRQGCGCGG